MTRKQTVIVKLRRSDKSQPWGIRIVGGADLGTPIIVTRSENEELHKGDVIKKIDDYDARDVRHVDAQNLLQKSESVKLVVDRPKVPTPRIRELPKSPIPPIEEYRPYSPDKFDLPHEHIDEVREERFYLEQPYRTTPLVLPGAKVKKDAPLGECYLRHHPNPMIRAAPHHYEAPHPEVAMKQKVAETVLQRVLGPNDVPKKQQIQEQAKILKEQAVAAASNNVWPQFNKPNYALKKPVKYDPSKSEAYKALQEEALGDSVHEVKQPARTGVFSPHKANQNKINQPAPKSPAASYVNALNDEGEKIHQSNSFKRIMYSVLGQTDY